MRPVKCSRVICLVVRSDDRFVEVIGQIEIHKVGSLDGRWLRRAFSDGGARNDVDVGEILARGGVFSDIRDSRDTFESVRLIPEMQTIEWPGVVGLDPEVLYGRFEPSSGVEIDRRTVREPTGAHSAPRVPT